MFYPYMKNKHPIQVIDLRFHVNNTTPKSSNCLKKIVMLVVLIMRDYLLC